MFVGDRRRRLLGGAIGYGLVDTSCTETPTVAEQLLETSARATRPTRHRATSTLLGGALVGTVIAAIGAGVVAC